MWAGFLRHDIFNDPSRRFDRVDQPGALPGGQNAVFHIAFHAAAHRSRLADFAKLIGEGFDVRFAPNPGFGEMVADDARRLA